MTSRLKDKRALILGATPGNVGAAIAKKFIEHGAKVVVAGRRADTTAEVAKDIGAHPLTCEITNSDQVAKLVEDAVAHLGGLDIGVNATGWALLTPFLDNTREQLDAMCAIQFTGPFQFYQALVRAMQQSGGSIINISSVTATIMMDNHSAYMGTKAGMDQVIRTIANEFGGAGIRANSIAPGGVADTPMSGGGLHVPAVWKLYEREIPLGRPGVAADVADVALWLASDDAKFITGQTIHVSGGQTLRRNPSLNEVYAAFQTPSA
jgi:2-hydroxycyclohexanecarboxyl-CoA dehydrogenase